MMKNRSTYKKFIRYSGSLGNGFFESEMTNLFFYFFWFVLQTTFKCRIEIAFCILFIIGVPVSSHCQTVVSGTVIDEDNLSVPYAYISIVNTIDGTAADSLGHFKLTTTAKGKQVLQASALGFETLVYPINTDTISRELNLKLKNSPNQLKEVVITAGSMDATDDRLLTHVKPVDLLSNASSQGDIVGAIQNLPGVQRNGGDQTGLFVRGGDAAETMVLIDGVVVQNPFFSSVPGIGQRSRFNPFQLKGTSFSTGGYSAKYGQALSSVLDLQTTDLPEKTNVSIGANVGGLILNGAQRMGDNAIEYSGNYANFASYYVVSKTNYDFYNAPRSTGLSTRWISRTDNGLFKMSIGYNSSGSGTKIIDPNNALSTVRFDLSNKNSLINASYNYSITDDLKLFAATAFSNNNDAIHWSDSTFTRNDYRNQVRAELIWQAETRLKITAGTEIQSYSYAQYFEKRKEVFDETLTALYLEAQYKPVRWFAIKPGVRTEYSRLTGKGNIAPRLSMALKAGDNSQFGVAGGLFYQSAATLYLLQNYRPSSQRAVHYLANYEWIDNNRSFRIEAYYKDYSKLVKEYGTAYNPNPYRYGLGKVDNSGYGYAKGFDAFWRDKSSVKNFDYWVTYSFVDTKRDYQNYLSEATPNFVSKHNFNLIARYYPESIHTVFSLGYNYASGRPYYNPSSNSFLGERSPAFQNLSLKISYLTNIKKMFAAFYLNIDNLTNYKNVLGYRYATDGQFKSPILPPQYIAVFFGVYLSISEFNKDEL